MKFGAIKKKKDTVLSPGTSPKIKKKKKNCKGAADSLSLFLRKVKG